MDKYVYWRYNVSMEVKAMNTSNITNYKPKEFAKLLNVTVKTLRHSQDTSSQSRHFVTVKTLQRWDSKYSSCIFM